MKISSACYDGGCIRGKSWHYAFFDNPNKHGYDLTKVPSALHKFVNIIHYLFVSDESGCVKSGYTGYAIDQILNKSLVAYVNKKVVSFGGQNAISVDVLRNCLSRMACWVRLAIQSIDHECPHWKVFLSFGSFDLSESQGKVGFDNDFQETCFRNLEGTFTP